MKRFFTLALLLMLSVAMCAKHVERAEALRVAQTVLPETTLTEVAARSYANMYIFNGEHAFVIVSADDCVIPILAYSEDFAFRVDDMPGNIKTWMESLDNEIQNAINKNLVATNEIRDEWDNLKNGNKPTPKNRTFVRPLIKTHWDQSAPYNNMCPGGSVTGCAATALAQVMKYWEWPKTGTGSHTYSHSSYGNLTANFGNTTYDWDNMIDMPTTSSSTAQQNAVATLMYHCGVALDMNYSPSSSGAVPNLAFSALHTYFDYNQSDLLYGYSGDYTADFWVSYLKSEMDSGRPVLYSGWDVNDAGHSFVCDGYDNNNYLHFNWGWSGSCDGYYAFGALNPGQGGTGSGSGCYNQNNYIIVGIHPNASSISAPANLSASVNGQNVSLSWSSVSGANRYKVYRDGFVINNNVSGTSFTDSNVIYGEHEYFVRAVNSGGVYSLKSNIVTATVVYSGPVPTNLNATVQNSNNVHLTWTAPASETAVLKYGDSNPANSCYGSGSTNGFYWGEKYTAAQLSPYAGMAITTVQAYLWDVTQYTLYIYKLVDGEMIQMATKSFSNTSYGAWYTINLTTPVVLDYTHDMMVVLYNNTMNYPAAYTNYTNGSGNESLYSLDGNSYYSISNAISWLLKTNITDGTYSYKIYRNGNVIANNHTQASYNDNGLAVGTYNYTVKTNYYGGESEASNTASATIAPAQNYTVAVSANPANGGNVTGGGSYPEGTSVTVTASANTGYIFNKWTENGTQVSTNASYTFTINGNRTLVAVFNAVGTLTVNATNIIPPTCHGGSDGHLTASAQGGVAPYVYSFNGQTSSATSSSHTFNNVSAGSYTLQVTDNVGTTATTTVSVDEPAALTSGAISNDSEMLCNGESPSTILSVQDATSPNTITYRWKKNGSVINNSNSAQYTPTNLGVGTFTFTREVMDNCNDWTASSGTWTVVINDLPNVTITGNTVIFVGESTVLTAVGAESYLWNTGETTASIMVSPSANTTYSVVGTDGNGCSSDAQVTVIVNPDGVGEEQMNAFEIFPNPTNGKVTVVCDEMESVSILSMTGQQIEFVETNDNHTIVDFTNYLPGTYMVVIHKKDGGIIYNKIIYTK